MVKGIHNNKGRNSAEDQKQKDKEGIVVFFSFHHINLQKTLKIEISGTSPIK